MIRPATPDDVTSIVTMVHELATFERAADQCALTTDALQAALFAPSPAVWAHVAVDDATGAVVGFAVWFLNFSTWTGRHGIWLEDLYVRPDARGGGYGTALLAELGRVAAERGYPRIDWWVLDWNETAHQFYRRLGAESMDEWTVWRLTGDALAALGALGAPGSA